MNNITKRISLSKHIVVIACENPNADSLGSASAMYSYLLQQHKKVSFFCKTKNLNQRYSFLPWFEKIRNTFPSSATLAISFDCSSLDSIGEEVECDLVNIDHHKNNTNYGKINLIDSSAISTTEVLYDFLKLNDTSINTKMATSLYAGVLDKSQGLMSEEMNAKVFDLIKELFKCGADFTTCNEFIMKYQTLAGLRLKAIMLNNMKLLCSAKVALFLVTNKDLISSGARIEDSSAALEESLHLPTIKIGILLNENTNGTVSASFRLNGYVDLKKVVLAFDATTDGNCVNFTTNTNENIFEISNKIIEIIQKEI